LIKQFLSVQSVQPASKRAYKRHLILYFRWATGLTSGVYNFGKAELLQYRAHLIESKSDTTALSYLITVKKFYKWLDEQGWGRDIGRGIPNVPKYKGYKKDVLTRAQLKDLINSTDNKTLIGSRDKAILCLLGMRGLRTIEVARINYEDLINKDTPEGLIRGIMCQRKGELYKNSFVAVTDEIFSAVMHYISMRGDIEPNKPLFVSHALAKSYQGNRLTSDNISRMVKGRLRRIGIDSKRITAHSLRHTVGVLLIMDGFDLLDVSLYLGHSSTEITQIYTRMAEELKHYQNKAGKALAQLLK